MMKFTRLALISITTLLINPAKAGEQVVVITNHTTAVDSLSRVELKNLYLGAPLSADLTPIMLPKSSLSRTVFTTHVIGLSESRLQSFLAQMRFSGRQLPLVEMDEVAQVVDFIRETPNAVAYIPASVQLDASIKVLYSTQ
jgi:ABC-type phosphate transport system substrate-binding protein